MSKNHTLRFEVDDELYHKLISVCNHQHGKMSYVLRLGAKLALDRLMKEREVLEKHGYSTPTSFNDIIVARIEKE
jgi:hypothetical protein